MSDPQPPNQDPPERTDAEPRLRSAPIIGGAVLGFIASWLLAFLTGLGFFSTYGYYDESTWENLVFGAAALPAIITVALLISTKTRYWGAGLLIGLAIGSLLGAGVCVGAIRSPWTDSSPVGESLPGSYPGTARHGPF